MSSTRILVTGATGGGSVLSDLLKLQQDQDLSLEISALVRRQEQAGVLVAKGVTPILFKDLDDSEALIRAASEHDIVINTANGYHSSSAKALVLGLAERKNKTGNQTHFIHTSGTSNLGDRPVSGTHIETRVFSDKDYIYAYEQHRENIEPYAQRTTDLVTVNTGKETGVKTYIIMSPTIYGVGSGFFNSLSIQIPTMIREAIRVGKAEVIAAGAAEWDHVHISDLAQLYTLIFKKILDGGEIPSGEQGIYFSETGSHTWLQLSQSIAKAGFELSALKDAEVGSITLEEAADKWGGGNRNFVELAFASRARTRSDISRELGWKPEKMERDWEESFKAEFELILKERRGH